MITISQDGVEASFAPEKGMNLLSFKTSEVEAIDQSTYSLFEERAAGLGALIGPHFHHRPQLDNEPYSHGIARQVPWEYDATETSINASLSSKTEWKGQTLGEIEGQDFQMWLKAHVDTDGLHLDYSITSDTDSVIGFHYYYNAPDGSQVLTSNQEPYTVGPPIDQGFHPLDPLQETITLKTPTYNLHIHYEADNQENSWQLWHPGDASFVCIEPLSAKDPRKPILSVSRLRLQLTLVN